MFRMGKCKLENILFCLAFHFTHFKKSLKKFSQSKLESTFYDVIPNPVKYLCKMKIQRKHFNDQ